MATLQECQAAVDALVERLAGVDASLRSRYVVDRTVSCKVYDLAVVFAGRLCDDGLRDLSVHNAHAEATNPEVTTVDLAERAQIRLSVASDDLVSLVEGTLAPPTAWATGRLRVQASPLDLLRLRQLL